MKIFKNVCAGLLLICIYQQQILTMNQDALDDRENINSNIPIYQSISDLQNIFFQAIIFGDIDRIRMLLKRGIDVNMFDDFGSTGLMRAALYGRKNIIELLLEQSVDINMVDQQGNTALIWTAMQGHQSILELLVRHNADLNHRNKNNDTALICAAHFHRREKSLSMVQFLLDHDAVCTDNDISKIGNLDRREAIQSMVVARASQYVLK